MSLPELSQALVDIYLAFLWLHLQSLCVPLHNKVHNKIQNELTSRYEVNFDVPDVSVSIKDLKATC